MAFLLLTTGQVLEVAESRQQVVSALSAAGSTGGNVTVKGAPLTIRSIGIIAVADTQNQLDFAQIGVTG